MSESDSDQPAPQAAVRWAGWNIEKGRRMLPKWSTEPDATGDSVSVSEVALIIKGLLDEGRTAAWISGFCLIGLAMLASGQRRIDPGIMERVEHSLGPAFRNACDMLIAREAAARPGADDPPRNAAH